MFQWDKTLEKLDVKADQIMQLFRSVRDVQLALPGLPPQAATAYLCQYRSAEAVKTLAVFHLLKSGQLACYLDRPGEVPISQAEAMLDRALMFIESMGFLMTDLDIHLLNQKDREMLWSSLPLQRGAPAESAKIHAPAKPDSQVSRRPGDRDPATAIIAGAPVPSLANKEPEAAIAPPPQEKITTISTPVPSSPSRSTAAAPAAQADPLLAAVETLLTGRPETRTRKKPPGPEELIRRREELRKNLGRILASL